MTIEKTVLEAALAGLLWRARQMKLAPESEARDERAEQAASMALGGVAAQSVTDQSLRSIFSSVTADDVTAPTPARYVPVGPLRLTEAAIFPQEKPDLSPLASHKKALKDALTALLASPELDETRLEAVLSVLQRYGWCLPGGQEDVSLYDEARITAALTVCLAEGSEGVVLVGGDISGVQDFIYTITAKGASKMLRGRSFYLQLLTEAVLRFVLRKLGIPYSNVIYSGGGHFYLLAPISAQQKLPRIQAEVGKILYQQHGTQLYLVLGHAPIAIHKNSFGSKELQNSWQNMHNQLTVAKNRRYAEFGEALFDVFALPERGGDPNQTCSGCGNDSRGSDNWDEWDGQGKICPLCRSFAEALGKKLPEAKFLALKFGEPQANSGRANTALDILLLFGLDVQFLTKTSGRVESTPDQQVVLWALDDPENERWPQTPTLTPRWLRYTANHVPMVRNQAEADKINQRLGRSADTDRAKPDQVMTFTQLNAYAANGSERLGVLRMDVDNLGSIFKDGLGEGFALSRIAALSSWMSLFFEGWLKRLMETGELENRVYTVYAGGDDVFLIAPWNNVPGLAQKITEDFAKYTGHPGMHISGGMAFIDGKYPVYQAAEDAENAERLAKDSGRNAFAFLDRAWKWDEFRTLTERKDELVKLVQGETVGERGGPKSILQTLHNLAQMEEETRKKSGRPVWGRWKWMGAYHLARMEDRYKDKAALKDQIARLREKLGAFEDIEAWGKAARWAQLETRKPKDERSLSS